MRCRRSFYGDALLDTDWYAAERAHRIPAADRTISLVSSGQGFVSQDCGHRIEFGIDRVDATDMRLDHLTAVQLARSNLRGKLVRIKRPNVRHRRISSWTGAARSRSRSFSADLSRGPAAFP